MKNAVVTGGASGIGLEFVKLLIDDNYKVFIIDNNNKEKLRHFTLVISPDKFQPIKLDLSISPKIIYEKLKNKNIEILINNAGFGILENFIKTRVGK